MEHVSCYPTLLTRGEATHFYWHHLFGYMGKTQGILWLFLDQERPCNIHVFTITGSVHLLMSQPC